MKSIRFQMTSEQEMNAKTQKELQGNLKDAKHALLDVQHQLKLAEKVVHKQIKLIVNL